MNVSIRAVESSSAMFTWAQINLGILMPLAQLPFKCLQVILGLRVREGDDKGRVIHGEHESDFFSNMLQFDQFAQPSI